jgi:hypothetical protein
LSSSLYDSIHRSIEKRDEIENSIENLANVLGDQLLIAYSTTPEAQPTELDALMRSDTFFCHHHAPMSCRHQTSPRVIVPFWKCLRKQG